MTGCTKALSILATMAALAGTAAAQPANDQCGDAIVLASNSSVGGTLIDATCDGLSACDTSFMPADVWYTFTPDVTGSVTFSTCDAASFDTALSVQTACGGSEIDCNDDGPGCADFTSSLTVELVGGVQYWVRVFGYEGAVGTFTLSVVGGSATGPENDDCDSPTPVDIGTTAFSSVGATTDGPAHAACLSNGETLIPADVWFTHTATETGDLMVATCGSAYDTFMAVYDGAGCTDLDTRLLACNDDAQCGDTPSVQSSVVIAVTAGQTYTIRVGGFGGETGSGVLELSMQAEQGDVYAMVFSGATEVPGVGTVQNEDVVTYNNYTGQWSLLFDGSDVGLSASTISGFAVTTEGDFLLSFTQATNIAGMTSGPSGTALDDSDIVRFVPTSLGDTTAGNFIFYFDGSDVGLNHNQETIDAISRLPDGRLILSISQNSSLPNIPNIKDEDLVLFMPSQLGPDTAGTFAMLLEGSDVALKANSENIDGVMISPEGNILVSTTGNFSVEGLSGPNEDLIAFTPTSLGTETSGTFATELDLTALGISSAANVTAMELITPAAPFSPELSGMGSECWADYDRDGNVTTADLFAFLSDFFAGNATADIDQSGSVSIADLFAFLSAFFSGCGNVGA